MTTPVRELVNQYATGKGLDAAARLGEGTVWIVPSSTDLGGFYIVARFKHGRKFMWVCSCKGFRYSEEDTCKHVQTIIQLTTLAKVKPKRKGVKKK